MPGGGGMGGMGGMDSERNPQCRKTEASEQSGAFLNSNYFLETTVVWPRRVRADAK